LREIDDLRADPESLSQVKINHIDNCNYCQDLYDGTSEASIRSSSGGVIKTAFDPFSASTSDKLLLSEREPATMFNAVGESKVANTESIFARISGWWVSLPAVVAMITTGLLLKVIIDNQSLHNELQSKQTENKMVLAELSANFDALPVNHISAYGLMPTMEAGDFLAKPSASIEVYQMMDVFQNPQCINPPTTTHVGSLSPTLVSNTSCNDGFRRIAKDSVEPKTTSIVYNVGGRLVAFSDEIRVQTDSAMRIEEIKELLSLMSAELESTEIEADTTGISMQISRIEELVDGYHF